ncbi:hypothetical protein N7478_006945 [Penicillium angulare]|uniref:uncharacterized protein n=1 Tax=Penicillium angulare TaxID=116970 RepID=UPI00253F7331|nr:uncharacterized protein N7478_006945 [Penicillium angulare]KAJ5281573.1 hypothetical protein N7478_006945 [Penicillium angulare]
MASPQGFWSLRLLFWAALVLVFSICYNQFLHTILFVTFGIGRQIQPIEDFPWACSRVYHPLLEACEDMWLDHHDRKLYAACTTVESRQGWVPGANKYNVSARSLTDHIAVFDIDDLDPESGLLSPRQLKISDYPGSLDLHGFDVRHLDSTTRFWLINHKPPVDPATGELLDAWTFGANSTIEVFDLDKATETLQYVKTIASDALVSPNNLAVDADGVGLVITNDHSGKTGTFRDFELLYGLGSLAYCRTDVGECHIADTKGRSPNGIARSRDGLYYVSQASAGLLTIHQLQNGQLKQVDTIPVGYGIDNLSFDEDGNLIAAAVPDAIAILKNFEHPHDVVAPSTILSISPKRVDGKWEISKAIEDSQGEKLPFSTIAIHDTQKGLMFAAGLFAPFITICEKQDIPQV